MKDAEDAVNSNKVNVARETMDSTNVENAEHAEDSEEVVCICDSSTRHFVHKMPAADYLGQR